MKRLLITTDNFLPRWDGIVRFLEEMIPRLKKEFTITIIAPDFPGYYEVPEGVEVRRIPLMTTQFGDINFSRFKYGKIKHAVKEADIVFNQAIGPIGIMAVHAAKKYKKPVISYIHCIDWELTTKAVKYLKGVANIGTRLLARHIYRRCNLLIVPSDEVALKLQENKIFTRKTVVSMGVDTKKFMPAEDKDAAKKRIGLSPETVIIGFCGRLGREKNLVTLYRAFRKLEKKHANLKLLIVGKGVKEEEKMFTDSRNIIMMGSQDNVIPYLQAMDIFVLPSLTETSSLATMEAMACGLAVLTTPVGYVKEYITEKENGMFFPFKNSLVLSLKLDMLISDTELRKRLGHKARKTIEEEFSWEKTAEGIKKAIETF